MLLTKVTSTASVDYIINAFNICLIKKNGLNYELVFNNDSSVILSQTEYKRWLNQASQLPKIPLFGEELQSDWFTVKGTGVFPSGT
jgi:hypothetical protein